MASMLTSTSSGSSATMGPPGAAAAPAPHVDEVREQDRFLPIANISRIMKKSLPPNAKIAKDAKETVQECVSEFISFVTSEASEKCQKEKRKTINGECYANFFFFFFLSSSCVYYLVEEKKAKTLLSRCSSYMILLNSTDVAMFILLSLLSLFLSCSCSCSCFCSSHSTHTPSPPFPHLSSSFFRHDLLTLRNFFLCV